MKVLRWSVLILLVLAMACGSYESSEQGDMSIDKGLSNDTLTTAQSKPAEEAKELSAADGEAQNEIPAVAGRKLIRNGQVQLRVKDLIAARKKLEDMVKQVGGFVADVKFNRLSASHYLEMTLRLPAGDFDSFLAALEGLGVLENEEFSVQDVTDQWVDLKRRIETKEKLAARLEELIASKSYRFRDLLEVERELARLRLEVERLQGALRGMNDKIAYSTLKITLHQEVLQKIVPPDSTFAPLINAVENIGPRLQSSIRAIVTIFALLLNLIVFLLPWALTSGLILLILYAIFRAKKPRKRKVNETNK